MLSKPTEDGGTAPGAPIIQAARNEGSPEDIRFWGLRRISTKTPTTTQRRSDDISSGWPWIFSSSKSKRARARH